MAAREKSSAVSAASGVTGDVGSSMLVFGTSPPPPAPTPPVGFTTSDG